MRAFGANFCPLAPGEMVGTIAGKERGKDSVVPRALGGIGKAYGHPQAIHTPSHK